MRCKIIIQPAALSDASEYVGYIRENRLEPTVAARWYDGLVDAILELEEMPSRFPMIPEQDSFRIQLRHLHYHSHRVIFHIDEATKEVNVVRIYHGARDPLKSDAIIDP